MNVHHITYSPQVGIVHLHFWGCNLNCRACLLKKELYDCHLLETAESVFIPEYIDRPEIKHISRFIARMDKSIPYRIDAYIPIGDNPWRRPTPEEMEKATSIARKHLDNVSCLTGNEGLKFEVLRVI